MKYNIILCRRLHWRFIPNVLSNDLDYIFNKYKTIF